MFETVVECLVHRKLTTKAYMGRCAMVFADSLIVAVTLWITFFFPVLMVVAFLLIAIGVVFTYLVFRNTNIEYEYSFFDGEMTIDKIMNKKLRKRLKTFNIGKMDFMAPEGSHHLGGGSSNRKMYDYSAQDDSMQAFIAVLYDDKNNSAELKFTPNEELLERLQKTYPRKVYVD